MKKQCSVQSKLGFSCDVLLNPQMFLSLTRQAVRAAGASHLTDTVCMLLYWNWHEREVVAVLGGRRRMKI